MYFIKNFKCTKFKYKKFFIFKDIFKAINKDCIIHTKIKQKIFKKEKFI
jgi:hypothetical protein